MLRLSLGVTRMDRIRNEHVRGTAKVRRLGDQLREARTRWYGHGKRGKAGYVGKRVVAKGLPGRRRWEIPKRRYLDTIREDMEVMDVVEDAEDRNKWRTLTDCGYP